MTDSLRINVIYDETVGLQARSFTSPAKYLSQPTIKQYTFQCVLMHKKIQHYMKTVFVVLICKIIKW